MSVAGPERVVGCALLLMAGLLAVAPSASAQCPCEPPAQIPCPTGCATCDRFADCCSCGFACAKPFAFCPDGYDVVNDGRDCNCGTFTGCGQTYHCELCTFQGRYPCFSCEYPYYGSSCGSICPGGLETPCNDNGFCEYGIHGSGHCFCNGGFAGSACQYSDAVTCSGNGRAQDTGVCVCFTGFAGPACEFSDAITCNGHGQARFDGSCLCEPGFSGPSCSQCAPSYFAYPTCRFCDAATSCSARGRCTVLGFCDCQIGWLGTDCSRPSVDSDGDGWPDRADNCAFLPNPSQQDTGGVGAGSAADGIGDRCQCADIDGDGVADDLLGGDVDQYREILAGTVPETPQSLAHCAVSAEPTPACDVLQFALMRRGIRGLDPPLVQSCDAANPPREVEPNHSAATATRVTRNWIDGEIAPEGDADWYRISVHAGDAISVSLLDLRGGAACITGGGFSIELIDPTRSLPPILSEGFPITCPHPVLYQPTIPADGEFLLRMEAHPSCTPCSFPYRLEIDVSPDADMDSFSLGRGDCDDENAQALPTQTGFFGLPRANGSFDYDCDGLETPRFTQVGSCDASRCITHPGWLGGVAPCGVVAPLVSCIPIFPAGCFPVPGEGQQQLCR